MSPAGRPGATADSALTASDKLPEAGPGLGNGSDNDGNDKSKRRFFGLGKRKDSSDKTSTRSTTPGVSDSVPTISTTSAPPQIPLSTINTTPLDSSRNMPSSPTPGQQGQLAAAASPARGSQIRSSSPRLHSPASSLIFERNVQESTIPDSMSATGIPSHIQVDDHIPPVLEASSIAITDNHLDPDQVSIVMHTAHQPAAEKVVSAAGSSQHIPGAGSVDATASVSPMSAFSPFEDVPPTSFSKQSVDHLEPSTPQSHLPRVGSPRSAVSPSVIDGSESYAQGSAEPADVRRLSFISFADVVQSEHRDADMQSLRERDSALPLRSQSPIPTLALAASDNSNPHSTPSPVLRSPASISSHGLLAGSMSPPGSGAPSTKGLDISASAQSRTRAAMSPGSPSSPTGGASSSRLELGAGSGAEIVVQTMRETLRRTGSGDLGVMLSKSEDAV